MAVTSGSGSPASITKTVKFASISRFAKIKPAVPPPAITKSYVPYSETNPPVFANFLIV